MKILVTGATGFIGSYVVPALLRKKVEVVATSRSPQKAERLPWVSKVQYIPCDLNEDRDNFFSFFGEPERLIHLAWGLLPNYKDPLHFERIVPRHYNFLKNIIQHGLGHLLVTGTCLEYGMQSGCLSEELDTRPILPYGLGKDTLRKYLQQLCKEFPITFQWVRLFYMYGSGQNEKSLMPQLERAVQKGQRTFDMSGGEQLRDYLPVEKVAEYIVTIALQNKVQGCINCCSGTPISIRRFVEEYLNKKGYSIKLNFGRYPYPDYEPMAFWGNNQKLQSILNQS